MAWRDSLGSGPEMPAAKAFTSNGSPTSGISTSRYHRPPTRQASANRPPPASNAAGRGEYKRPAIQAHMLIRVVASRMMGKHNTCHACNPPATIDGNQTTHAGAATKSETTTATILLRHTKLKN